MPYRLTAHDRKHLTGPWDVRLLERVSGLAWCALTSRMNLDKPRDELRGTVYAEQRDNGWAGVGFAPDPFLKLLRDVLKLELEHGANGSRRKVNMAVLRDAIRQHEAHALHLHVHAMFKGLRTRDPGRLMRIRDEVLKVIDRMSGDEQRAHLAALRIGGKAALDTVVMELSGGVFVPEDEGAE